MVEVMVRWPGLAECGVTANHLTLPPKVRPVRLGETRPRNMRVHDVLDAGVRQDDLTGVSKFKTMKNNFAMVSGARLDYLAVFPAVDQLRCLNNAIKHRGVASPELAAFPGWIAGTKVRDFRKAVTRLRPLISGFVNAVTALLSRGHLL